MDCLYAKALPSKRTGYLFNAFSYPTKISPEAIALYIAAHTKPGDTVFDGFAGSGTTGLAALLCENPIDERLKLTKQVLGNSGYLILAGAGGKHICAACVRLADDSDLAIDQTLYWQVFQSEEEAWFRVGMLNSHAMTEAIMPFNPKGDFGERHIHALPYRLMPAYNSTNEDHMRIAALAEQIADQAQAAVAGDDYLNDPNRALHIRRTKLREKLRKTTEFQELEALCAAALGV